VLPLTHYSRDHRSLGFLCREKTQHTPAYVGMGPKRRKSSASAGQATRKRRKGILGAAGYDSEEDEDYAPTAPKSKPTRARKARFCLLQQTQRTCCCCCCWQTSGSCHSYQIAPLTPPCVHTHRRGLQNGTASFQPTLMRRNLSQTAAETAVKMLPWKLHMLPLMGTMMLAVRLMTRTKHWLQGASCNTSNMHSHECSDGAHALGHLTAM
jgi:hypothetical protein